ncbi:vegetative cell wall protein gp1, partial [Triticum aestivum]|uniref:vegetative cell wall protein gp1 n=1 Tax=Triticum aestivum TaxID=4565 RepID=UPI001D01199E
PHPPTVATTTGATADHLPQHASSGHLPRAPSSVPAQWAAAAFLPQRASAGPSPTRLRRPLPNAQSPPSSPSAPPPAPPLVRRSRPLPSAGAPYSQRPATQACRIPSDLQPRRTTSPATPSPSAPHPRCLRSPPATVAPPVRRDQHCPRLYNTSPLPSHLRDGMLHLASTAPRACSTWLPQRHRQTSLDAVVRTAAPPSRNAPPATIRRRAVLQVCPVDASSSCLVPAKRTAVSLLPHPSRYGTHTSSSSDVATSTAPPLSSLVSQKGAS